MFFLFFFYYYYYFIYLFVSMVSGLSVRVLRANTIHIHIHQNFLKVAVRVLIIDQLEWNQTARQTDQTTVHVMKPTYVNPGRYCYCCFHADNKYTDQTARMCRLIRIFVARTFFLTPRIIHFWYFLTGYPQVRGPVCYNCDDYNRPEQCHRIAHCATDQVCTRIKQTLLF